jgi:hypothetical protein
MALSLHEAVVPGFLQTLVAMCGLLDKAEAAGGDILSARLAPDMFDFAYQVKSVAVHSWGAIDGVRRGGFSPDRSEPHDFAALRERLAEARRGLEAIDPAELDALADREVIFSVGTSFRVPFTGANFLLSFSTPNLHFHAATAYALLRARGVAVGKVDYLGQMRVGYPA